MGGPGAEAESVAAGAEDDEGGAEEAVEAFRGAEVEGEWVG